MHKRILDLHRLLPLVLLTTLVFPSLASAAGQPAQAGNEQLPASARLTDTPPRSAALDFGYLYAVQAGDDVWHLAVVHGLSMEVLVQANNLQPPYWLYPGDVLYIPAAPVVVARRPTPAPTPAATVAPVAATAAEARAETARAEPPPEQAAVEPAPPPAASGVITASAAVVAVEVAAAAATDGAARQPAGVSEGAMLIFNQMNEKRTAHGLPALTWSDQLTAAAQAHADDCARRGWGSHVGSDGARLRTRLARAGYYPSWASENWANASSAQNAFNMWWWEGPGGPHYENILGRNYTEVGIGVAQSRWGYYYIVDFGKP